MKTFWIFLISIFMIFLSCEKKKDILIKVYQGEQDELGVKCAYLNLQGDTIIPLGKYYYCFTDTFKSVAIVLKSDGNCVAIDRNENELFGVYWFDNGPDPVKDGLFRITKNGKTGYANVEGKIIIEPQFECALPFENSRAKVAYNCQLIPEGEHSRMESSEWFFIDLKGNKID